MARFACLLLLCGAVAGATPPTAPHPRVSHAALVRQLGSDDYHEREAATRLLLEVGIDSPELRAAINSPNPEVRRRALEIKAALRYRAEEHFLAPGRAFAARGEVDLFVAATARWELPAKDTRLWLPAAALARQLLTASGREGPWRRSMFAQGPVDEAVFESHRRRGLRAIRQLGSFVCPDDQSFSGHFVQAAGVRVHGGIVGSSVVSRGDLHIDGRTRNGTCALSVVFVNGNVVIADMMHQTVLVSDGDVEVPLLNECLVIARGNITATRDARGCVLVAGGKVQVRLPDGERRPNEYNVIFEGADRPLGIVRFFELTRVGLGVMFVHGLTVVTEVTPSSLAAQAGVRRGDVIARVGRERPANAESLRRLLRAALACGDATVELQRDGKKHQARMTLQQPPGRPNESTARDF